MYFWIIIKISLNKSWANLAPVHQPTWPNYLPMVSLTHRPTSSMPLTPNKTTKCFWTYCPRKPRYVMRWNLNWFLQIKIWKHKDGCQPRRSWKSFKILCFNRVKTSHKLRWWKSTSDCLYMCAFSKHFYSFKMIFEDFETLFC